MYGSKTYFGESWCSDCRYVETFMGRVKQTINSRQGQKEILFVEIPIDKDKKFEFHQNPITRMNRVPTLAYFENGVEMGRILENEMFSQYSINKFVDSAYQM
jgi:hypothetical protein